MCSPADFPKANRVGTGCWPRGDVEDLSTRAPRHWRGVHGSYCVSTEEAAEIFGVNVSRVRDLAACGRIPAERHIDGA